MRRFGLVFVGLLGVWLGGCVAETQAPEGSSVDDTSEESASGGETEGTTSLGGDARMRAGMGDVGSTQQNLRIDERPPPQPWHDPATPPSPGDGKK